MTDDDFEQLILFNLMDYDINNAKYAAVDYDGEIILSDILLQHTSVNGLGDSICWQTHYGSEIISRRTDIYLTDYSHNYKSVLVKL